MGKSKSKFKRDFRRYTIVFIILIVVIYVAIWYYVPEYTQKNYPRLSVVHDFSFRNQYNQIITQKNIRGKIAVVNFFFSTCQGICPKMNGNVQTIYQKFAQDSNVVILSHTVDPETDTPAQLLNYSKLMGVNDSTHKARWYFLTGTKTELYRQARESYTLDDPQNNVGSVEDQFIHTQLLALVDRTGAVRRVYDGLVLAQIDELVQDILDLEKGVLRE